MLREEDITNVRSSIRMKDLAEMYGYKVTRSGFMKCPFHSDHSPSMKIYGGTRGYYCFVCNAGGDVIDFVRRHDGLDFEPAVRRLAQMFNIPVSDGNRELSDADKRRLIEQKERREASQKAEEARIRRMGELSDEIQWLEHLRATFEPMGAVWTASQRRLEKLEAEWETLFEQEGGNKPR